MKIETIATGIAILGTVFVGGMAWQDVNSKIEALSIQLTGVRERTADEACLAIVTRQIAAIERGNQKILAELSKLSDATGCSRPRDIVVAMATRPASIDEMKEQLAVERNRRRALDEALAAIDDSLDLHRNAH